MVGSTKPMTATPRNSGRHRFNWGKDDIVYWVLVVEFLLLLLLLETDVRLVNKLYIPGITFFLLHHIEKLNKCADTDPELLYLYVAYYLLE